MNKGCVSITGGLHTKLKAYCLANAKSQAQVTEGVINRALDKLEAKGTNG